MTHFLLSIIPLTLSIFMLVTAHIALGCVVYGMAMGLSNL